MASVAENLLGDGYTCLPIFSCMGFNTPGNGVAHGVSYLKLRFVLINYMHFRVCLWFCVGVEISDLEQKVYFIRALYKQTDKLNK